MAILNVTPDSFSDGGRHHTVAAAVAEGLLFADLGAAVIDIGGESTRPRGGTYGAGAGAVSLDEELRRVLPVLEGIRAARPDVALSIDTRKVEVAQAALDAGADVVNVVTGLDVDARMLDLVRDGAATIVLNHCRGTPETTFAESRFGDDVVREVAEDLERARRRALDAGIAPDRVLLDPGLGFGKTAGQNVSLMRGLDRIAPASVGLVVGASRKAFLSVDGRPPADRLPESLAAAGAAALQSSRRPLLVRVHDVAETVRFLTMLERLRPPEPVP